MKMRVRPSCWLGISFLVLVVGVGVVQGGNLFSTWTIANNAINATLNYIDPNTAQKGQLVYYAKGFMQIFSFSPAVDSENKRAFIPFTILPGDQIQFFLFGFDLSDPGDARLLFRTLLPYPILVGVLYDPVTEGVYVIGTYLTNQGPLHFHMAFVDATTGVLSNVTTFPPDIIPGVAGHVYGGAAMALDPKNRVIVMGTYKRDPLYRPLITVYDMNTKQFTTRPNNSWKPYSMVFDTQRGQIMCLIAPALGAQNLSYAILDPSTASYKLLATWPPTDSLLYLPGAVSTLDVEKKKLYSILGTNPMQQAALATSSSVTGELEKVVNFGPTQPLSLFVL